MAKKKIPDSVRSGIPKLGPLPAGWKTCLLGELLQEQSRPVSLDKDKVYQLVVAKRSRGGIVSRGRMPGKKILTKTQFEIKANDFLISNRQIVHGACGIVPEELDGSIVSNEYTIFRPTELLDLRYLWYLAHTEYFQQTCFHSSVGVHIEKMIFSSKKWLTYPIHLPPLEEQRKIADTILNWDRSIELAQQLLASKRLFHQGLQHKFLIIEDGWKVTLKDLGTFSKGKGISKAEVKKEGLPCIRYGEIYTQHDYVIRRFTSFVSAETAKSAQRLKKYDLIFAGSGETIEDIGKSVVFIGNEEAYVGGDTVIFSTDKCDPLFLSYLLNSRFIRKKLNVLGQGEAVVHIYAKDLQKIELCLPSLDLQVQLSKMFNKIDEEIQLLRDLCDKFRAQRRALIQLLLSARKRVGAL